MGERLEDECEMREGFLTKKEKKDYEKAIAKNDGMRQAFFYVRCLLCDNCEKETIEFFDKATEYARGGNVDIKGRCINEAKCEKGLPWSDEEN
jgi:ribosomal protein S27E